MSRHIWDWDWSEKANPKKTGTYRSCGDGLATADDMAAHVANVFPKLQFVAARRVEDPQPTPVNPINPEHVMHGTMRELRTDVLKSMKPS